MACAATNRLLDALRAAGKRVEPSGEGWSCECPAHEDDKNSLAVTDGRDRDRAVAHCHAGCTLDAILGALGLEPRALFDQPRGNGLGPPAATYVYVDEAGIERYRVLRFPPKSFKQQHRCGRDWQWGLGGNTPGSLVPVEAVVAALASALAGHELPLPDAGGHAGPAPCNTPDPEHPNGLPASSAQGAPPPEPWRMLLWTCHPETRIGRAELLAAVGRPRSWLYRHTSEKAEHRIPHRKLDGELVFVVGEVRAWLREREEIVRAGPLEPPRLTVAS
jgi:hypothetical protein